MPAFQTASIISAIELYRLAQTADHHLSTKRGLKPASELQLSYSDCELIVQALGEMNFTSMNATCNIGLSYAALNEKLFIYKDFAIEIDKVYIHQPHRVVQDIITALIPLVISLNRKVLCIEKVISNNNIFIDAEKTAGELYVLVGAGLTDFSTMLREVLSVDNLFQLTDIWYSNDHEDDDDDDDTLEEEFSRRDLYDADAETRLIIYVNLELYEQDQNLELYEQEQNQE